MLSRAFRSLKKSIAEEPTNTTSTATAAAALTENIVVDMDLKSKIEVLEKTDWFKSAPPNALAALASRMVCKEYSSGEELQKEDSLHGHFFVVLSGSILRQKNGVEIDTKEEYSITGLLHTFQGDPAHATLTSGPDGCKVLEGNHEVMHEALKESAELTESLLSQLARIVRKHNPLQEQAESSGIWVVVFSSKNYERKPFEEAVAVANRGQPKHMRLQLKWVEQRLDESSVVLAAGAHAVCMFTQDTCDNSVLDQLHRFGVQVVALRCAGFNNVDLNHATALAIPVVRVPAYSPHAVAEHAVALMLALNRKLYSATARSKQGNYSLEGLVGFDMHGKTVAVVGTGKIGRCTAEILLGFGCKVMAFDAFPLKDWAKEKGITYVDSLENVWKDADIVTLHVPLLPSTTNLLNKSTLSSMKRGVMIINTSRGQLINTKDLMTALKSGQVGYAGLDVYEGENEIFFKDNSSAALTGDDDNFALLQSFHNVMVTGHQAFLTREALEQIAKTTITNLVAVLREGSKGDAIPNLVKPEES